MLVEVWRSELSSGDRLEENKQDFSTLIAKPDFLKSRTYKIPKREDEAPSEKMGRSSAMQR